MLAGIVPQLRIRYKLPLLICALTTRVTFGLAGTAMGHLDAWESAQFLFNPRSILSKNQ